MRGTHSPARPRAGAHLQRAGPDAARLVARRVVCARVQQRGQVQAGQRPARVAGGLVIRGAGRAPAAAGRSPAAAGRPAFEQCHAHRANCPLFAQCARARPAMRPGAPQAVTDPRRPAVPRLAPPLAGARRRRPPPPPACPGWRTGMSQPHPRSADPRSLAERLGSSRARVALGPWRARRAHRQAGGGRGDAPEQAGGGRGDAPEQAGGGWGDAPEQAGGGWAARLSRLAAKTRKSVSAGSRPERKKSCATTVPRGCGAARAYAPSGQPPAACGRPACAI
jgi:hypothetical protein